MIVFALIKRDDDDGQERRSRLLLLVYGVMAVAAMAAAAIPQAALRGEFLGNLTVIAAGMLLITGIWGTAVSSLPYGTIGGGIVGAVFALSGSIVHTVNRGLEASASLKLMVASTTISAILGSVLALAGGSVVWAFRLRRPTSPHP